jgi:hypothetical protein
MPELNISPLFTVEDIHKVREYHFELTKSMNTDERRAFYKEGADEAERRIQAIKKQRKQLAV